MCLFAMAIGFFSELHAQGITLSGKVTRQTTGEALSGVSITIKGLIVRFANASTTLAIARLSNEAKVSESKMPSTIHSAIAVLAQSRKKRVKRVMRELFPIIPV